LLTEINWPRFFQDEISGERNGRIAASAASRAEFTDCYKSAGVLQVPTNWECLAVLIRYLSAPH